MRRIVAMIASTIFGSFFGPPGCAAGEAVRPPAVAGSFYPGDAKALEASVRGFLDDALPARGEKPIALVSPHAGYVYSGQIAADAFRQAAGHDYDVVVILGTNHTVAPFDGMSVYQGAGYRTPLGVATSDRDLAARLAAADKAFAYRPDAHVREHSEEVQVPFVQVVFPGARIVTAVVGTTDPGLTARFGRELAKALEGRNALIVASSDLSHYPAHDDADEADRATLRAIASLDPSTLGSSIAAQARKRTRGLVTCACGEAPVLVAMSAARELGARRGIVVSYANSGDTVVGESGRVVGYGAVAFTAGEGGTDTSALDPVPPAPGSATLTGDDRAYLLGLARRTLEQQMATGMAPLPRATRPTLARRQGAFVTLESGGTLRGCIGHMAEDTPLALTVARMAVAAASEDPRFPPVRASELASIELEISVLTPMQQVAGPEAIVIGRDGVLIRKDGRSAVFLPQVAPEQGWNRDEMLEHLCRKAGLPHGAWRKGATFYTFQADVFGEKDLRK
jgi:AmmeMemoRadiSam system protein B/AmmeMemoRadiSam system protein A